MAWGGGQARTCWNLRGLGGGQVSGDEWRVEVAVVQEGADRGLPPRLGLVGRWRSDLTPSCCRVFGFVARKQGSGTDNVCHLFAEHDPEQPASAIVNFVSKVMIGSPKKI